jgi:hypothetical protein
VRVLIRRKTIYIDDLLESHVQESVNQKHEALIASMETSYIPEKEEVEDLECDAIL